MIETAEMEELLASLPEATRTVLTESGTPLAQLIPEVYDEMRRLAGGYLQRERSDHTLQPTALVHEAYLRLLDQRTTSWQNRAHLLAISAKMMRRILMQHAETRGAAKRGGNAPKLSLDEALNVFSDHAIPAQALHSALRDLEKLDPRQGQIVELRFFGGLSIEETAEVLGVSPATVKREWQVAKLWLKREMAAQG